MPIGELDIPIGDDGIVAGNIKQIFNTNVLQFELNLGKLLKKPVNQFCIAACPE